MSTQGEALLCFGGFYYKLYHSRVCWPICLQKKGILDFFFCPIDVYTKRHLTCKAKLLLLTDGKGHQCMRKNRVSFYQIFGHLRMEEKAVGGKEQTWLSNLREKVLTFLLFNRHFNMILKRSAASLSYSSFYTTWYFEFWKKRSPTNACQKFPQGGETMLAIKVICT